jgi:hypothetical protein
MNQKEILMLAIKDKFSSLPKTLQDAITSSDYQQKLLNIGQKYKLTVEQIGTLEQETTFVLLGITLARDYADDLQTQLKVDDATLNGIVADVNAEVFVKIKDILMTIEEETDEQDRKTKDQEKQDGVWADEMSAQIAREKGEVSMKEEDKVKDESREELLAHIENPPASNGLNLSALKISKPVVGMENKLNSISTPNLSTPGNNPPAPPKSGDPYREMPE